MRSRAARVTIGAAAWAAIGAAAYFVVRSEQQLTSRQAALRTFDRHAREVTDALADARAGQQAYVALGQGIAFWVPKVADTLASVNASLTALREATTSAGARAVLEDAATAISDLGAVNERAREYVTTDQPLMASDVIFSEGASSATKAARQVETARLGEHQAFDAGAARRRREEALALAGAGGFSALMVALLIPVPRRRYESPVETPVAVTDLPLRGQLDLRDRARPGDRPAVTALPEPPRPTAATARAVSPVLKAAADLCTSLGRVTDVNDLNALLGKAADIMDASGLIVWLGSPDGADLQPVLSHGYSPQILARLSSVPRSATNAAATAYRSGRIQIVGSRPGAGCGAVVAPLLSPEGCIGAFSAEIRGGGEASDSVQALATLVAAQLAPILASTDSSQTSVDHRQSSAGGR